MYPQGTSFSPVFFPWAGCYLSLLGYASASVLCIALPHCDAHRPTLIEVIDRNRSGDFCRISIMIVKTIHINWVTYINACKYNTITDLKIPIYVPTQREF